MISAGVLRRDRDGNWPEPPDDLGADDALRLDSIDFWAPLRDAYRTTTWRADRT